MAPVLWNKKKNNKKTLAAIKAVKSIQVSFFLPAEINQALRGEERVLGRGKKNSTACKFTQSPGTVSL